MRKIRDIDIKNRTYYFHDDMVNIKDFDSNLLKIGKESFKKHCYLLHWIYHK